MSARTVLFVTATGAPPAEWRPEWGLVRPVQPGDLVGVLRQNGADVALIEATSLDPLAALRELHAGDPALQPVLLAPPGERPGIERALLFTPGVGETWVRERPDAEVLERAAAVTRQRRSYRQLQKQLAGMGRHEIGSSVRPLVGDAYLAALLQVLPDPAIAVDADARVLYWSAAAERMLKVRAEQALGRTLGELIDANTDWSGLIERGAHGPVREEIELRGSDGEACTLVASIAPILLPRAAGRAVLLHDITAERKAQAQLAAQAEELESQALEMESQAAELEVIATEREELLHQRDRTLSELRHAMETRTRFYASMNHEIRTPINAILGYTDLLLSGTYGELPPQQRKALERSQRAARHLIEIVNDLLDLSKLEAGRMDLQLAPVSVPELLQELLATTLPLAAEHGSEIRVEAAPCRTVITDARRVRQVLLNLLSNAAKFGKGRPIILRCTPAPGDGVGIEVEDQGVGIAEADLPAIFDEFVQVGDSRQGGTGLGLPISRRLAELLGGRLTARSTPGRGSTFRLDLPPVPPSADDAPAG